MPRRPRSHLLALFAALALALAPPAALAQAHRGACSVHVGSHSGHAVSSCTHAPKTKKPHSRHKTGAHHTKHTPKHGHARVPHPTAATQAASCEDGSAPLIASGAASCVDGSEPSCESGAEPIAGASGTLLCPAADNGQQDGEASCEAEACTFDSEGPETFEEG